MKDVEKCTADGLYQLAAEAPDVETFIALRASGGMAARTPAAVKKSLANGLHSVVVKCGEEIVGMGRVIGDAGCFYQIVDVVVRPEHQGRGLGKLIMAGLMDYLDRNAEKSAYVSLIADGPAHKLYAQFGFKPTAPVSIGMAYTVGG